MVRVVTVYRVFFNIIFSEDRIEIMGVENVQDGDDICSENEDEKVQYNGDFEGRGAQGRYFHRLK